MSISNEHPKWKAYLLIQATGAAAMAGRAMTGAAMAGANGFETKVSLLG